MYKKLLKIKTLLILSVLAMGGMGTSWAADDSYTITFKTGTGDGSSLSAKTTTCASIIEVGSSYVSGNLVTATNAYGSGGSGLKLGTKSGEGVIKMNLSSKITPTKIVVKAKLYNSGKTATISVNGGTAQNVGADWTEYTFEKSTEISYLEIKSSKYLWVSSISVYYPKSASLSSISLSGTYPTTFFVGDAFSHEGMTVTANYDDNSTENVTSKASFTGYDMTKAGQQTVTVTYEGQTATYDINVSERPKFTVTFSDDDTELSEESAGAGVTLPSRSGDIGDYSFAGWTTSDVTEETATKPTIYSAGSTYYPTANITLYPLYARTETSGDPVETLTQTLAYDTWMYYGNTTDKSSYRLFSKDAYVESAAFDRSKLTKVNVYAGTFGTISGDKTFSITDGTTTWATQTVSTNNAGTKNEVTSEVELSGTGTIRIVSNCGESGSSGIRLSKVEIYTLESSEVTYYTSHPSSKETPTWTLTPSSLSMVVDEADEVVTIETNYDGTITASTSDDAIATVTKTDNTHFTIHAVGKGDATITFSGAETESYKAVNKTLAVSVTQKYTVTIETPTNGTLVIKNGEEEVHTGDKFFAGTELTAVVTPNEDYKTRNWQAVDASTHTYTSETARTYTMTEHDVTFKANFDAITYYTVSWSVNGKVVSTNAKQEDGTAISFTAPEASTIPEGYTFQGWSATPITTPQATAPTYVNVATCTADVTYYAVLAKLTATDVTATFDAASTSNLTSPSSTSGTKLTWTDNETGIALYISSGQLYAGSSSNPAAWNITKSTTTTDYYLSLGKKGCRINKVEVTVTGDAYAPGDYYAYKNYDDDDEEGTDLTSSVVTDGTLRTLTLTDDYELVVLWSTTSQQTRMTKIVVYATTDALSNFTTLVSLPITIAAACTDGKKCYGTFSSEYPFVVSDEVTVAEIGITDGALNVQEYATGAVVPANTGVMVSAKDGGTYIVDIAASESSSILGTDNRLRPTGNAGISAEDMETKDRDCLFYRLTMHNGTQIGFYWGAEDGAAFSVAANKAYLAVTKEEASSIRGFNLGGTPTGISTLLGTGIDENQPVYNALGQRVRPNTKGIVIQNGKKYFKK